MAPVPSPRPDLEFWLAEPQIRIEHRRTAQAEPEALWRAAQSVRLNEARRLGRLIRLRIPGLSGELEFGEMFRRPPFNVLHEDDRTLISGLVGRIWTLRRDYPKLGSPEEFREWSRRGTVRVLFANWVQESEGGSVLVSQTRVQAVDRRGRLGLAAVRPLISSSQHLIGRDGIDAALRRLEAQEPGRAQASASPAQPRARRRRRSGATR